MQGKEGEKVAIIKLTRLKGESQTQPLTCKKRKSENGATTGNIRIQKKRVCMGIRQSECSTVRRWEQKSKKQGGGAGREKNLYNNPPGRRGLY